MDDVSIGFSAVVAVLMLISIGRVCYLAGRDAGEDEVRIIKRHIQVVVDSLPGLHALNSHTLTLSRVDERLKKIIKGPFHEWPRA